MALRLKLNDVQLHLPCLAPFLTLPKGLYLLSYQRHEPYKNLFPQQELHHATSQVPRFHFQPMMQEALRHDHLSLP